MGVTANKKELIDGLDWIIVTNVGINFNNGAEEFFRSEVEGDLMVTFSHTQNLAAVKAGDDLYIYHNIELVCEVL